MGEGRKGPVSASPAPPTPLPPQATGCLPWPLVVVILLRRPRARHRPGGSRSVRLPPVPRLRFEDWTYEDFESVLDNEDEIEELSRTAVQAAKVTAGAPS